MRSLSCVKDIIALQWGMSPETDVSMKRRELFNLGVPGGEAMKLAIIMVKRLAKTGVSRQTMRARIAALVEKPEDFRDDEDFGELSRALLRTSTARASFEERTDPAPYRRWGSDFDQTSIIQIENACRLPVSVAGALMPDAHTGYGLPIGGILAARNAVIPYAVGMDIACRMKMTVLDMPVSFIRGEEGFLRNALKQETRFGIGAEFKHKRDHSVMDKNWSVSPITQQNKGKAWRQLGTSGSGNHFVEFGTLTLDSDDLGLKAGVYFALLSHSGSRGTGGSVAQHYSRLAMRMHPELPRELLHLAWFDMDSDTGREYWAAMQLMGLYAAANHELIHRHIAKALKARVLLDIENHHNFAWKERHFGEDVIVHRKGATPAGKGMLGVIPGSMASPGYICRGRGNPESMNSAAHGAGRAMSRKAAKNSYTWNEAGRFLKERDVALISAGLDEVPMAYKDIDRVMAAQRDLVDIVARFDPKLVKMAPAGERPED
jgi:tRNA-splicing ligase RtcB